MPLFFCNKPFGGDGSHVSHANKSQNRLLFSRRALLTPLREQRKRLCERRQCMNAHFVHLTLQHSCCHSKMRIIPSLETGSLFVDWGRWSFWSTRALIALLYFTWKSQSITPRRVQLCDGMHLLMLPASTKFSCACACEIKTSCQSKSTLANKC